jgi:hypothetical protein
MAGRNLHWLAGSGAVLAIAAMVLATPSRASGSGHCGMYPENVYATAQPYADCAMRAIGEKPLWRGVTRKTYRQQIRFAFTEGHGAYTRIIDFTELADGTGMIETKVVSHNGPDALRARDSRRVSISVEQVAWINDLGEQTGAWEFESGNWDPPEDLYSHCQFLDMERVNPKGYRFSTVTIGCNHPAKLMPLVDYLTGLIGIVPRYNGMLY